MYDIITDSELLEKVLEIVTKAHKGQLDLDDKPVILHPLVVGLETCADEIVAVFCIM